MIITKEINDIVKYTSGKKTFVFCDINTRKAGKKVFNILDNAGIDYSFYEYQNQRLKPDEEAVGAAIEHFDPNSEVVISIGSGVLNDIGKLVSRVGNKFYIIVATAPSMDGYASATSSMERDGLKISLKSKFADLVVGDAEILKNAPLPMFSAGLGDMIAKYTSLADWRISNLLTGEEYFPDIAERIRQAVKLCVENVDGLMRRDEQAVMSVFDGLISVGFAMQEAGSTRPASGVEHYFSHLWDMRGLEYNIPTDFHGTQCGYASWLSAKLYEDMFSKRPDKQKALNYVKNFDIDKWHDELRKLVGKGAEAMIAIEQKEGKYDKQKHAERLEIIIDRWDDLDRIRKEEVPPSEVIKDILDRAGIKCESPDPVDKRMIYKASKDIRDKYILSRLAWDIGILDEQEV